MPRSNRVVAVVRGVDLGGQQRSHRTACSDGEAEAAIKPWSWSCPGSVDGLALGSQASSVVISRVLWVGSRAA